MAGNHSRAWQEEETGLARGMRGWPERERKREAAALAVPHRRQHLPVPTVGSTRCSPPLYTEKGRTGEEGERDRKDQGDI
jgi:hypothetical protein